MFLYLFNILADYSVNIRYDISNIFPICKRRLHNKPRLQIRSDQEYSLALLQKGYALKGRCLANLQHWRHQFRISQEIINIRCSNHQVQYITLIHPRTIKQNNSHNKRLLWCHKWRIYSQELCPRVLDSWLNNRLWASSTH